MYHNIPSHAASKSTRRTVSVYQISRRSLEVSRSKDPYAICMYNVHSAAPCNSSSNAMYHRITHIELHQCTKFGIASSKFPRTGGPLSNSVSVLARATRIPRERRVEKRTDYGSMRVTCKFGTGGALRFACRSGKRTKGAKHLHVHCTCTCTLHSSPVNRTAPSTPFQGLPTYRVWCL